MKHALVLLMALPAGLVAASAAPMARAEQLDLDHRLYPPLHAAMENPGQATVYYDASQPGRVLDRILVRGSSAERDWTEALELLVTRRDSKLKNPDEWFAGFQPNAESPCPVHLSRLASDQTSVTFALEASSCAGAPPLTGLYRVVLGRKSVYLVGAKLKGVMSPAQRDQWLALLGSAKLSG